MNHKLIAALAVSLGFGTAAIAQTAATGAETDLTASAALPSGWEGDIGEALFDDQEAGTLRAESEVRSNFEALTFDQQAMVRSHCALVDTAAIDLEADVDADAEMAQDLDLEDLGDTAAADLETDTEIETGTAATDLDQDIETDTVADVGIDTELESDAADLGVDTDIETAATPPGAETEFETETEFTQDMEPGTADGAMGLRIEASIQQLCAWIDE